MSKRAGKTMIVLAIITAMFLVAAPGVFAHGAEGEGLWVTIEGPDKAKVGEEVTFIITAGDDTPDGYYILGLAFGLPGGLTTVGVQDETLDNFYAISDWEQGYTFTTTFDTTGYHEVIATADAHYYMLIFYVGSASAEDTHTILIYQPKLLPRRLFGPAYADYMYSALFYELLQKMDLPSAIAEWTRLVKG